MASPDGYPPLPSLAAEREALEQAFDGVAGVTAEVVADATPAAVLDALSAGADVFHFSGHGTADGGIVLAGPGGGAEVVPADRLAEMVQAKGVRLAVLGACDTGRRDDTTSGAGWPRPSSSGACPRSWPCSSPSATARRPPSPAPSTGPWWRA